MTTGRRRAIFAALVVVCLGVAAVAIAAGLNKEEPRLTPSAGASRALSDAQAKDRPTVVYRTLKPKGQVVVAPVAANPGRPAFTPLSCDRVYFAAGRGICLVRSRGIAAESQVRIFGPDLKVRGKVGVAGIPSRARVSPDGRYGAVTLFVTGDSYAAAGSFSTRTTIIDLARGQKVAELEDFTVTRGGRQVTAVDVNYWGVTFAPDGDTFYATLATGGRTYLIKGSVSDRTARVIHENVECPSLSPDGTRIAYKKRVDSGEKPWRLTVLDLATMRETPLAEPRSVDDQVEWLDDSRVLYGTDGQVWVAAADGSGKPRRFIAGADSPAVVRW